MLKKAGQDELATCFGFAIAKNGHHFVCGQGMNPKHSTPAYHKKLKWANGDKHFINRTKTEMFLLAFGVDALPHSVHQSQRQDANNSTFRGCQSHKCLFSAHKWLPTKCCADIGDEDKDFTLHVSKQKMWDIVQLLNAGHCVPSQLLQYMLQQVLPHPVVLHAQLLTNFRLKAKRLGPMCSVKSMDISPVSLHELTQNSS
jgi:hypothetical protein